MTLPVKVLSLIFGTASIATVGVGGVYFNSKETIGNKLENEVLGADDSFKESWKNQHAKLLKENDDLKDFSKLEQIKKNSNSETAWTELRDWCSKSYSFTYKDIFSKEDNARLNLTKKYCIQSTKERLEAIYTGGTKKVLAVTGEGDKSEFVTNYKKLKDHTKDKLPDLLKEIDTAKVDSEADKNWVKVQTWCSEIHKKPFKGESDTFKLASKICVKES
ncbi:hypothetical protein MHC_04985 [Mycoplasma haemocanis str. Illinois]|uniref:Uncharacterized protein n=1 Tax=Mycoplasma haemocanis (strain Illinois) TaxID=1111676 RepID=H6N881_MYCHN|nr:hypothetical protein [Mycoplasma haemocanis]AEW45853.1 hypothetical protein MHC_04985 [Mycoplasma haemocanis str. Illinois]